MVEGHQNDQTMEKAHEYQHHQAMEKACASKPIHQRMPQKVLRKMIGG
jgi:ribosomal protein L13